MNKISQIHDADKSRKIVLYKNERDDGLLVRWNHGRFTWHCDRTGKYVDHTYYSFWSYA